MKHKSEIVLRALLQGQTLEVDGYKYCLSDDYRLCIEATKEVENSPDETVLLASDMYFDNFMRMCANLPESAVTLLAMNTGLTSLNRRHADQEKQVNCIHCSGQGWFIGDCHQQEPCGGCGATGRVTESVARKQRADSRQRP